MFPHCVEIGRTMRRLHATDALTKFAIGRCTFRKCPFPKFNIIGKRPKPKATLETRDPLCHEGPVKLRVRLITSANSDAPVSTSPDTLKEEDEKMEEEEKKEEPNGFADNDEIFAFRSTATTDHLAYSLAVLEGLEPQNVEFLVGEGKKKTILGRKALLSTVAEDRIFALPTCQLKDAKALKAGDHVDVSALNFITEPQYQSRQVFLGNGTVIVLQAQYWDDGSSMKKGAPMTFFMVRLSDPAGFIFKEGQSIHTFGVLPIIRMSNVHAPGWRSGWNCGCTS